MKIIRSLVSKIWVPAVLVGAAFVQAVGMDIARSSRIPGTGASEVCDTVIYENRIYTKFRDSYDALKVAEEAFDSTMTDSAEVFISARDTMKVPDSLKYTDPFRYKYYVAIKDSLTHILVRDSLRNAGDSIDWPKLESLY